MANDSPYHWMRRFWTTALPTLWAFATTAGGNPDFLADADLLAKNLKDPKLVALEVRYHPHRYFTVGQPYDEAFAL